MRKPAQGILQILRFNRHLYAISGLAVLCIIACGICAPPYAAYLYALAALMGTAVLVSLLVSYYVYDLSGLYRFEWLDPYRSAAPLSILNIHAGFDETSVPLRNKFAAGAFRVMDFYDPQKHTEVSIKRARAMYAPYPGTQAISTGHIPADDRSVDYIFLIFSAHEIRNDRERILFFKELKRILKPDGKIFVTEHLRDLPNLLAYTIGAFHFHSLHTWLHTFRSAGLNLAGQSKITPFITNFILQSHGTPS